MKRDGKILPGNRKKELWKGIRRNYCLYLFLLPAVVFIGVFCYAPMYGVLMAFQDYSPGKGILGSPWVGLKWFRTFFELPRFWQIVKNTLVISLYSLVVGFPIPILLALMINSVKGTRFKKLTQTVTYMPHFISTVILVGMMSVFLSPRSGFLNHLIAMLGGPGRPALHGKCSRLSPSLCMVRHLAEYGLELHHLSGSSFRRGPGAP